MHHVRYTRCHLGADIVLPTRALAQANHLCVYACTRTRCQYIGTGSRACTHLLKSAYARYQRVHTKVADSTLAMSIDLQDHAQL
jgi:hypothetical protein